MQTTNTKRCQITRSTKWLSRVFEIFDFCSPKIKISIFQINAPKIKNFTNIQKPGIYVIELSVTNMCAKFQPNTFIFGCAMAQNRVMVLRSLFETRFLEFLIVVRQNK